jgi:glycine cleavage system H protein
VFPDDVSYTAEHEWIRRSDSAEVKVGITSFAQESLGDIVYVSLPAVGAEVVAGEPMGEVESTKSVSDIYAPVTGKVSGRNEALESRPELVNSDPYGEGWLVAIEVTAPEPGTLLDVAAYTALVESQPGN